MKRSKSILLTHAASAVKAVAVKGAGAQSLIAVCEPKIPAKLIKG